MMLDVIDLYAPAFVTWYHTSFGMKILYVLLMSSLSGCPILAYSLNELSKWSEFSPSSYLFWLSSALYKPLGVCRSLSCQTFLICWVFVWLLSTLRKQLSVDRCLDRLCVLKCLQCSPRASCYLEQGAGGSWLEIILIHAQAYSFCFLVRVLAC